MNNITKKENTDMINVNFNQMKIEGSDVTLSEVNTALARAEKSFKIHNHSHTTFSWLNQNLSHYGLGRNMRQITAELNRKKGALTENKYKYLKKCARLEIKLEKAEAKENTTKAERKLLEIEIEEMREGTDTLKAAYEGAMKDVMILIDTFEQLKLKIVEKYGKYDEETLELEEKKYWIRRLFSQATREVRQDGKIHTGNQEALEQIGVSIPAALSVIHDFLQQERAESEKNMGNTILHKWLDHCADKYCNCYKNVLKYKGIEDRLPKEYLMIEDK